MQCETIFFGRHPPTCISTLHKREGGRVEQTSAIYLIRLSPSKASRSLAFQLLHFSSRTIFDRNPNFSAFQHTFQLSTFERERFDGASRSDKGGGCCQWCDTGIASQQEGRRANLIQGFGVNSRANNDEGDDGQIRAPDQEVRQCAGWGWHEFDNLRVWVWDHSLRSEPQIRRWDSVWHGFDGSDSPATAATAPLLLLLPASSQNLKDFLAVS